MSWRQNRPARATISRFTNCCWLAASGHEYPRPKRPSKLFDSTIASVLPGRWAATSGHSDGSGWTASSPAAAYQALDYATAFDEFRHYLASDFRSATTGQALGQHAAVDYASRLRRVQAVLQTSLENAPPMVLRSLAQDVGKDPRMAAVSRKVVGDIAVALRAYANFVDDSGDMVIGNRAVPDPSLGLDVIVAELRSLGFVMGPKASKTIIEFRRDGLVLYAKVDSRLPIIVHPSFEEFYSTLIKVPGTVGARHFGFYHNAKLSRFPKRDNGRGPTHYGLPFGFVDAVALRNFIDELQHSLTFASRTDPEKTMRDEMKQVETEKVALAKARVGQGRFRADLLNFWRGHCALTEVANPQLLRASHIKSWKDSSNGERLNVFNGLLLSVHLDALFDRALITFRDTGEMLISKRLWTEECRIFGLTTTPPKLLLNVPHLGFMRHHQNRFDSSEYKGQS
jgi:hypothetical protein